VIWCSVWLAVSAGGFESWPSLRDNCNDIKNSVSFAYRCKTDSYVMYAPQCRIPHFPNPTHSPTSDTRWHAYTSLTCRASHIAYGSIKYIYSLCVLCFSALLSCRLFPDGSVAVQHPRSRRLEALQLSAPGSEATATS
jgi:hypothetical protein